MSTSTSTSTGGRDSTEEVLDFIDASPSAFHAVASSVAMLEKAGFERLSEASAWALEPGRKYFFTRNQSTLVAFAAGDLVSVEPDEPVRFVLLGAHTDSCCLKVNPVPTDKAEKYDRACVSTYGGGQWHTWFDRDLCLAGRVVLERTSGVFTSELVHVKRPIARVPTLAIHLQNAEQREAFKVNKEDHLKPVLQTELERHLDSAADGAEDVSPLRQLVADELRCEPSAIRGYELNFTDTQPSTAGGIRKEFIFAPRLDNLMMSYLSLKSLALASSDLSESSDVWAIALFDHEEVGSASSHGAGSPIMSELFTRVLSGLKEGADGCNMNKQVVPASIRKSVLVSADMAHAVHPNYSSVHQPQHKPRMGEGLVIKTNANQRYATTSTTAWALEEIARRHAIPVQQFVVKNDMGCGSTIGPIIAENTGLRTVDVGVAQLSMHSIREQCAFDDVFYSQELFRHFFREFASLDETIDGTE